MIIITEEIRLHQRMKKYTRYRYEGLSEVYVQSKKLVYFRSYDAMFKLIRKKKFDKVFFPVPLSPYIKLIFFICFYKTFFYN